MSFPPLNEQMDIIRRGTVDLLPEEELEKKSKILLRIINRLL